MIELCFKVILYLAGRPLNTSCVMGEQECMQEGGAIKKMQK